MGERSLSQEKNCKHNPYKRRQLSNLDFYPSHLEMQNLTTKMHANAKLIEGFQIMLDDGEAHSTIVDLAPDLGTGLGPALLSYA